MIFWKDPRKFLKFWGRVIYSMQETLCVNAIREDFGALRKEGTPAQDPRSNMKNQGRLKSLKSARTTCARERTIFDEAHANLSHITADQQYTRLS